MEASTQDDCMERCTCILSPLVCRHQFGSSHLPSKSSLLKLSATAVVCVPRTLLLTSSAHLGLTRSLVLQGCWCEMTVKARSHHGTLGTSQAAAYVHATQYADHICPKPEKQLCPLSGPCFALQLHMHTDCLSPAMQEHCSVNRIGTCTYYLPTAGTYSK